MRCFRGLVGEGVSLVGWYAGRAAISCPTRLFEIVDLLLNYMYASRTLLL